MTNPIQAQYEDYLRHVDTHGVLKGDRTGTGLMGRRQLAIEVQLSGCQWLPRGHDRWARR